MEDNVTGTLTATVSYYAPGGEYQTSATKQVPVKNVVVRGYGNPVEVTQVRQILGGSEGGETYFDDVTLPGSKVMDAYKGDVVPSRSTPRVPMSMNFSSTWAPRTVRPSMPPSPPPAIPAL